MASFFEVNLLTRRRNGLSRPLPGPQDGDRTSVVEIYIYDDFATSFQRSCTILSMWTRSEARRAPALAIIAGMSEPRQPGVIGSLPSTRPHRRSDKRTPAEEGDAARAQPAPASAQQANRARTANAKPARASRAKRAPRASAKPGPAAKATTTTKAKPAATASVKRTATAKRGATASVKRTATAKRGATASVKRTATAKPRPTATSSARKRVPSAKPARATPAAAREHASERPRPRATQPPFPAPEPTPDPTSSPGPLQTAVEAAVELTEIGLRFGTQALRATLSRLPRP
jgi:hypothetical protein